MPKVCTTVNLLDAERKLVTLRAGDEVPEWALKRVTNPKVLAKSDVHEPADSDAPAPGASAPTTPVTPEEVRTPEAPQAQKTDYAQLRKPELQKLAKDRGLSADGKVAELVARLEEADSTPAAPVGDVDVWSLDESELRTLAQERGVDIGEASTQVELATLLEQAKE